MTQPSTGPMVITSMGVGEVLDTGLRFGRQHFRTLVVVYAVALIPQCLLFEIANWLSSAQPPTKDLGTLFTSTVITTGLTLLGCVILWPAAALACAHLILGYPPEHLSLRSFFSAAMRRLAGLLGLTLLLCPIVLLLFIVPPLGLYLTIRSVVAWLACLIEGQGPRASLARSWQLTRGAWWHTLWVTLGGTLVYFLTFLINFAVWEGWKSFDEGSDPPRFVSVLLGAVVDLAIGPLAVAMAVVLYFELRARTEGWDLEQRSAQFQPIEG
jgi:hypothetical protein